MTGEGIENAPHRIDFKRDLPRRSSLSPLEEQMFDEVGDTVIFTGFVAGAICDPDPDRNGMHVFDALSYNPNAVSQSSCSNHVCNHISFSIYFQYHHLFLGKIKYCGCITFLLEQKTITVYGENLT
jgi:hypothetical protein